MKETDVNELFKELQEYKGKKYTFGPGNKLKIPEGTYTITGDTSKRGTIEKSSAGTFPSWSGVAILLNENEKQFDVGVFTLLEILRTRK